MQDYKPTIRSHRQGRQLLPTVRPLPYYSIHQSVEEKALAESLRADFVAKIARRLPGHHLGGFRNDTVIRFVKKHKKQYPCFLRSDIAKFYPSISHQAMIVGTQIAYRDLLGLDYVPRDFKQRYLGALNSWCKSLPLPMGLPLGSALSAILAPLMLVPLWLELKRRYKVPFLIYMDDVLVCCKDKYQAAEIYTFLENRLQSDYGLSLNANKTVSGSFSRQAVSFCGFRFSGGYAGIKPEKVAALKERFTAEVRRSNETDTRAFLKRVNRKIDGFANYYKHGDVAGEFATLDSFVRKEVRGWFRKHQKLAFASNNDLHQMGLHSLQTCYKKVHREPTIKQPTPCMNKIRDTIVPGGGIYQLELLVEIAEGIKAQLCQLIRLQRSMLRTMERVYV